MKKSLTIIFALLAFTLSGHAQRSPNPVIDRDPIMETDAKHNLDVANQYFKLKKAYKSVIFRFEETYAAYPDFSRIDEFLYIAGMSSYYLAEGKGRQKIDTKNEREREKFEPGRLIVDAKRYLTELVDRHPDSRFAVEAKKTLTEIASK